MTIYYDTSSPGNSPLTASGQVFVFGVESTFYLSVASNLIVGQGTGPSVEFEVLNQREGITRIQVDYGTTNTTYASQMRGYGIKAIVPAGSGSVNCRVVVSSEPFPLTIQTTYATGSVAITGVVETDVGQGEQVSGGTTLQVGGSLIDPRQIRDLTSGDQPDVTANQSGTLKSNLTQVAGSTVSASNPVPTGVAVSGSVIDPREVGTTGGSPSRLQQDSNGYIYHNQAAVTSNGGDTLIATASSLETPSGTQNYTITASPPSGTKWIVTGLVGIVQGASDAVNMALTAMNLYIYRGFSLNSGSINVGLKFAAPITSDTIGSNAIETIMTVPTATDQTAYVSASVQANYNIVPATGTFPMTITSDETVDFFITISGNGSEGVYFWLAVIGYAVPL